MNNIERRTIGVLAALLAASGILLCEGGAGAGKKSDAVPRIAPRIIRSIPHAGAPFIQGLCYSNGVLYESDGLYGESAVRSLDTAGGVIAERRIDRRLFGEGCALLGSQLFQITWREQRCYVYSVPSLAVADSFAYDGEGWGLCTTGGQFVMSDGSATLARRDHHFALVGKTAITCEGKPLVNINELEYARGRVYANVWYSDFVFEIDLQRGTVERIIDCGEIVRAENPESPDCVLNGIAFRPETGLFYITGKKWKKIYIVDIPAGK